MSFYSQQKRRNGIVKAYEKNMRGPKGSPLFVRDFADARFALRKNIYIAARKPAICGDITGTELRSASLDTSRIAKANNDHADERFWGKLQFVG